MRFILLTRFHSQHAQGEFVIRLSSAAAELGHTLTLVNPADIFMDFSRGIVPPAGGSASLPNCPVRWRELQFPAADLIIPLARWDDEHLWQIVETLRAWGQPILMSNRIPMGDNVTMARLFTRRGIPTPRTWVLTGAEQFTVILPELNFPCVFRSRYGGSGRQFTIAQHTGEGMDLAQKFSAAGQPFVVQDLPQPWGEDIRILMVGTQVAASVLRRAPVGFVRPRESGNLSATPTELTDQEIHLAQQAAAMYAAPFCSVSLLRSVEGPLMLEVSRAPVLSEMEIATGLNLAIPILRHLEALTKELPATPTNIVSMPTARL